MSRKLVSSGALCCAILSFTQISTGTALNDSASTADIVCSYAPSQSKTVVGVSGAAGGAAATTAGIGSLLGLSVVTHSSGALILSGSSGYIAGTLGVAVVAPVILTVGAVVGGTAVTVELLCSPKNHPEGYKKVVGAAHEFGQRTGVWMEEAKAGLKDAGSKAAAFSNVTLTSIKGKSASLYQRVFRKESPSAVKTVVTAR